MPNMSIDIPLYFTGITIYMYIYTELAPKLSATASVTSGAGRIEKLGAWGGGGKM